MLSGESTPLQKESIQSRSLTDNLNLDEDRVHLVYAGTKIIQVSPVPESTEGLVNSSVLKNPLTSEQGALAYVLQTGFGTAQGKLVRMMFFSSERVSVHSKESILFILFLIIFALFAAYYVWVNGQKHAERSTSKLLLDCILIITSVVPPELPMELSMAVNSSLLSLSKLHIFLRK
ncbi:hypothetical protein HMI56_006009 [Coelomomyces lativittatus]|nr:hypothetical protein HMI56_006009 [Coelomomyces lativittatus]